MRHARILDVLSAVTAVAAGHPEVEAWWYAPPRRLRLQGEIGRARADASALEVVVQTRGGASCQEIAAELARRLPSDRVSVRLHQGDGEARQLFRLLSGGRGGAPARADGEAGRPA